MTTSFPIRASAFCGVSAILCLTAILGAQPPAVESDGRSTESKSRVKESDRVAVAVARDRARVMHNVYAATLDVLHHHYFQRERAVLPARAMEDIFSEIKQQSHADARWISVNLKAMSINHEPNSEFEKRAAREIADGKSEYEMVEEGFYRRAGAIPLGDGCISCHGGIFREGSKIPRFAGLVISIPVLREKDSGE